MGRIDLQQVRRAAAVIRPHVHRTPVFTSDVLDSELDARVFFKCENLQRVGAFKARGAVNAVLSLDDDLAACGVVAHSSGNHGAAMAYAAGIRGIPCTVVMPQTSSPIKVEAVRRLGAEVVLCEPGQRETTAQPLIEQRGLTLVHPYENPRVICGQGTAALELLDRAPDLQIVIAPVGGGGLLAGTAVTVKSMRPHARVLGAEPEAVDDAYRSLKSGQRQPAVPDPRTWCDGLLTGLGEINFEILRERGVEVLTVSEEAIIEAARFFLREMKLAVEPSGATVLAAMRSHPGEFRGRRVGAIVSGGNTDFRWLTESLP